jgi:hypothetical protein
MDRGHDPHGHMALQYLVTKGTRTERMLLLDGGLKKLGSQLFAELRKHHQYFH